MDGEKLYVVREYDTPVPEGAEEFDLAKTEVKHCLGCWACWLRTPGRCVHKDLDEFYRGYLAADTVRFYCEASGGFVSSNMKAMIDRLIPLVLPYITWERGESAHLPRYGKYPAMEVVFRGDILPGEEKAFLAYWERTAYMLFSPGFTGRREDA